MVPGDGNEMTEVLEQRFVTQLPAGVRAYSKDWPSPSGLRGRSILRSPPPGVGPKRRPNMYLGLLFVDWVAV